MTIAHGSVEQVAGATRPLRIAMIGLRGIPATYGGVERAVEELAAHLVGGHDVTVYARSGYSAPNEREHRGMQIVRLPRVNAKHAEDASHTAIAIMHALGSRRFDLIHLHATGPGAMSALVRLAGMPVVVTVHGLDWRREIWGRGVRAVSQIAAMLTAKGPHRTIVFARELERHYGAPTVYIPNGVQIERDPREPPQPDLRADAFVLRKTGSGEARSHLDRGLSPVRRRHAARRRRPRFAFPEILRAAARSRRRRSSGASHRATVRSREGMADAQRARFRSAIEHRGLAHRAARSLSAGRCPVVSAISEYVEPVTVGGRTMGITVGVGDEAALARAIEAAKAATDRRAIGDRLSAHVRRVYDWREISAATEAGYYVVLATTSRRRGGWGCGS